MALETLKKCADCKELKSLEAFGNDCNRKDGKYPYCKHCVAYRQHAYREKYPHIYVASNKRSNLKKHGLSVVQYEQILDSQGGVCAILGCGSSDRLSIDHDHACCSGKKSCGLCVRGILCSNCNAALGLVKDSLERLDGLCIYLGNR